MLTINRPFYEYRDIYLFIAVGLAAFITTFIVLGVITTINIDQLSRSAQESGISIPVGDDEPSSEAASASAESEKSSSASDTAPQSNSGAGTFVQPSAANNQTPALQPPTISAPSAVTPSGSPSGSVSQPPTIIVQQPAPTTPAPAPSTSNPQQSSDNDNNLINLQLPLGIGLGLL